MGRAVYRIHGRPGAAKRWARVPRWPRLVTHGWDVVPEVGEAGGDEGEAFGLGEASDVGGAAGLVVTTRIVSVLSATA